ncbi:MAG: STAS domain-containing protein [Leptospiraceae bacterium]|nr:STAS domain-containing protein [Leptospiraceae bacterium]
MEITSSNKNDTLIVNLTGSLDIYTATEFKNFVESRAPEVKSVIINMENLHYMDSSGIGVLIRTMNSVKELNIFFKIAFIPPQINRIFKVAGLLTYFQIMSDEEFKENYG